MLRNVRDILDQCFSQYSTDNLSGSIFSKLQYAQNALL